MSALDRFLNSEYFVKKDAKQNAKKTGIKSLVGKFEVKENELKLDAVKATTSQSWLWAIGFKFLKFQFDFCSFLRLRHPLFFNNSIKRDASPTKIFLTREKPLGMIILAPKYRQRQSFSSHFAARVNRNLSTSKYSFRGLDA